jgi:hypothetical protein
VIPDPPEEEWEATKLTFRIRTGEDLWRICHKSKWGRITVPLIEFEIQADGQRHIDTLYNHIGNAITNLAAHATSLPTGALHPRCKASALHPLAHAHTGDRVCVQR